LFHDQPQGEWRVRSAFAYATINAMSRCRDTALLLLLGMTVSGFAEQPPPGRMQDRPQPAAHGPHVDAAGGLRLGGELYRGIGVNYLDAFSRTLKDPTDTSYREGFSQLASYKIPFVRFMACGFWPSENRLYFQDKEEYFRRLDGVVRAAEEFGIGLIPSLFWHTSTVPDLMDEPRSAWGDPTGKTHAFLRAYTREVVTRYRESPAIWGWEFGNEYNLAADLPNAAEHRPPIWPALGTRLARSEADDLDSTMLETAFRVFAEEVRRLDPDRIRINGDSSPRPSAWHQRHEQSWGQDSVEQLKQVLTATHPDPLNGISAHIYRTEERRFHRDVPVREFLEILMDHARQVGKPLFVGEFGANEQEGHSTAREQFMTIVRAIEESDVPLAALWVFDFEWQNNDWNVTPTNRRAYQLETLREINTRRAAFRPAPKLEE
jgi:hypothetical protein